MTSRRFPAPWQVEQTPGGYKVLDANGQALAYVYARETKQQVEIAKVLTFDEARTLYHLLYRDISDRFDDPEEILTANEICHLGQPVRCLRTDDGEWAPTLRFALSAPLIAALLGLDAQHLAERFRADLERVGRKIRLAATLLAGDGEKIVANEDTVARC